MAELLRRYEQPIYRFGLRMCQHEEDAREVLQDTLLAAYRGLADFRGDAQLSTWMYQIARSFCIKRRRKPDGAPSKFEALDSAELQQVPSTASSEESRTHARQVATLIQAAIATLPEDQREALVLRDVEGLTTEEAANVVGSEIGAFKSRLHRARLSLKKLLANVVEDSAGDIACPQLTADLAAYAASEIDQAACAAIEQHLSSCARCTAACDALKQTVSLCRALPGGDVPAAVKASVRGALRAVGLLSGAAPSSE